MLTWTALSRVSLGSLPLMASVAGFAGAVGDEQEVATTGDGGQELDSLGERRDLRDVRQDALRLAFELGAHVVEGRDLARARPVEGVVDEPVHEVVGGGLLVTTVLRRRG